jgi:hypothetical protein
MGGKVEQRTVALLGSSESIIGSAQTATANHEPYYYTLRFLNRMLEGDESLARNITVGARSWSDAVSIGLRALPRAEHELEFFARLLEIEGDLVVGTPLYVAIR